MITAIFVSALFVFLVVVVVNSVPQIIKRKRAEKRRLNALERATRLASNIWKVQDVILCGKCWVIIKFEHYSAPKDKEVVIPVAPNHPDVQQFRELRKGDVIVLSTSPKGLEGVMNYEPSGYLRIIKVYRPR